MRSMNTTDSKVKGLRLITNQTTHTSNRICFRHKSPPTLPCMALRPSCRLQTQQSLVRMGRLVDKGNTVQACGVICDDWTAVKVSHGKSLSMAFQTRSKCRQVKTGQPVTHHNQGRSSSVPRWYSNTTLSENRILELYDCKRRVTSGVGMIRECSGWLWWPSWGLYIHLEPFSNFT